MNSVEPRLDLPADYRARRLPIPAGWYLALPSAQLPEGAVRHVTVCGRELAVWRSGSGRARAADNVCAHLGARLAPRARVRGGQLECPQHHHRFDGDGRPASGGACLSTLPVREQDGMVLIWHHPEGDAPGWEIPEADPDGWSAPAFRHLDVDVHPQHVMQDLADTAHFETVHRYGDIVVREPLATEGPRLTVGITFGWDTAIPGMPKLPASFRSEAWGLGYQRTEVVLPLGQLQTRHFVMPTPLDATRTRIHLGVAVRPLDRLGRAERFAGPLSAPLRLAFRRFMVAMFQRDVGRDATLWRDLYHLDEVLPSPDPSIAAYRAWARQFYV